MQDLIRVISQEYRHDPAGTLATVAALNAKNLAAAVLAGEDTYTRLDILPRPSGGGRVKLTDVPAHG